MSGAGQGSAGEKGLHDETRDGCCEGGTSEVGRGPETVDGAGGKKQVSENVRRFDMDGDSSAKVLLKFFWTD